MNKKILLLIIVAIGIVLYFIFGRLTINGVTVTNKTHWAEIVDDSVDRQTKDGIKSSADVLLTLSRFDDLESTASEYRASRQEFKNGEWALQAFYYGLANYRLKQPATPENWALKLDRLREWVKQRPNSATARIALSEFLIGYAYEGRGRTYADSVTEAQWKLFADRMQEAESVLKERPDLQDQCPQWRAVFLNIRGPEWTLDKFIEAFNEAVAHDSMYVSYYTRMAANLLPRWYGGDGDTQRFAKGAADSLGGVQGDILYARIIWSLDVTHSGLNYLQTRPSSINWRRVKRGLESL